MKYTMDYAVQVDRTGIGGSFETVSRFGTLAAAIEAAERWSLRHPRWQVDVWNEPTGSVAWTNAPVLA